MRICIFTKTGNQYIIYANRVEETATIQWNTNQSLNVLNLGKINKSFTFNLQPQLKVRKQQ